MHYKYHGPGRRRKYFEGWYQKFTLDHSTTISLIPSLHFIDGTVEGRLQIIRDISGDIITEDFRYTEKEVEIEENPFRLRLGESIFNENSIEVRLKDFILMADMLKEREYGSSIMGPFQYLDTPCYHDLICLSGKAQVRVESSDIAGEYTSIFYSEKDRGHTFPRRYIWIQSHFSDGDSIFLSIADVPLPLFSIQGFISVITWRGKDYRFSTYDLSMMRYRRIDEKSLEIQMRNRALEVRIMLNESNGVSLLSPKMGKMDDTVRESLSSRIELHILDRETEEKEILNSDRCASETHGM